MHELRLVGANDDSTLLLVVDANGEQYSLVVDDRLRSAVRRPVLAPGTPADPAGGGPAISPREIQIRIRAGDSAEDVAAATGVPVEKVRRYEGPVLAERAHMADSAQRASVRRSAGEPGAQDGSAPALYDAVTNRLEARGLTADAVRWDAWRRDDGRWTVRAGFPETDGHSSGDFLYDSRNRASTTSDEGARWLLGEEPLEEAEQIRQFVPRLAAVGAERGLGGIGMESGYPDPRNASASDARSGRTGWSRADQPVRPEPHERTSAGERAEPASASTGAAPPVSPPPTAGPTGAQGRPVQGGGRRKRASVPAWDDILFGAGTSDD